MADMEDKNLSSNDLMVSLGSENFRQYFRTRILPHLEPIEELRIKLHKKQTALIILSIVIAVGILVATRLIALIGVVIAIPIITWSIVKKWIRKKFKESTGKGIIPTLFSYWGTFKYCTSSTYTKNGAYNLLGELEVYQRYDDIEIDDCLKGRYNGLDLMITELDVSYVVNTGKSTSRVQVFDGLMMEVDMNKNFTSHTIIRPDKTYISFGGHLKRVALEDPEFEKEFDVYSTDQIDSRYILTTAFMQRLLEFKRTVNKRIEVVFLEQKAYFFINYGEDKFELPLNESVLEMKHYQNILLDLARMLKIVDALKLEQKIGM